MRLGDGVFVEKEGEKCEYSVLDEADKDLKHHDGHGCHVREEVNDDEDEDLAGKNVAEEPERERYDACNLTEKLDNPYKKSDDRPEIEEFPPAKSGTNPPRPGRYSAREPMPGVNSRMLDVKNEKEYRAQEREEPPR